MIRTLHKMAIAAMAVGLSCCTAVAAIAQSGSADDPAVIVSLKNISGQLDDVKYLGEKADNGLYPKDPLKRLKVDQWLFYGSATYTTLAQQFGHFVVRWDQDVPKAKEWYTGVLKDMLGTLDRHLGENAYVAGDAYTIADISIYPDTHLHGVNDIGLCDYPNVKRWHDAIEKRPAVQKAWVPFA